MRGVGGERTLGHVAGRMLQSEQAEGRFTLGEGSSSEQKGEQGSIKPECDLSETDLPTSEMIMNKRRHAEMLPEPL